MQHCIHFQLMIYPVGLRADYYPPYPTIVDSFADSRNVRTLAVYGGLFIVGMGALVSFHVSTLPFC
jgi:hypothetical protein